MADWNVCGGMWFGMASAGLGCGGPLSVDGPAMALVETGEVDAGVVAVLWFCTVGVTVVAGRRVLPRDAASAAAFLPRLV